MKDIYKKVFGRRTKLREKKDELIDMLKKIGVVAEIYNSEIVYNTEDHLGLGDYLIHQWALSNGNTENFKNWSGIEIRRDSIEKEAKDIELDFWIRVFSNIIWRWNDVWNNRLIDAYLKSAARSEDSAARSDGKESNKYDSYKDAIHTINSIMEKITPVSRISSIAEEKDGFNLSAAAKRLIDKLEKAAKFLYQGIMYKSSGSKDKRESEMDEDRRIKQSIYVFYNTVAQYASIENQMGVYAHDKAHSDGYNDEENEEVAKRLRKKNIDDFMVRGMELDDDDDARYPVGTKGKEFVGPLQDDEREHRPENYRPYPISDNNLFNDLEKNLRYIKPAYENAREAYQKISVFGVNENGEQYKSVIDMVFAEERSVLSQTESGCEKIVDFNPGDNFINSLEDSVNFGIIVEKPLEYAIKEAKDIMPKNDDEWIFVLNRDYLITLPPDKRAQWNPDKDEAYQNLKSNIDKFRNDKAAEYEDFYTKYNELLFVLDKFYKCAAEINAQRRKIFEECEKDFSLTIFRQYSFHPRLHDFRYNVSISDDDIKPPIRPNDIRFDYVKWLEFQSYEVYKKELATSYHIGARRVGEKMMSAARQEVRNEPSAESEDFWGTVDDWIDNRKFFKQLNSEKISSEINDIDDRIKRAKLVQSMYQSCLDLKFNTRSLNLRDIRNKVMFLYTVVLESNDKALDGYSRRDILRNIKLYLSDRFSADHKIRNFLEEFIASKLAEAHSVIRTQEELKKTLEKQMATVKAFSTTPETIVLKKDTWRGIVSKMKRSARSVLINYINTNYEKKASLS